MANFESRKATLQAPAQFWLFTTLIIILVTVLYFNVVKGLFHIWISSDEHAHGLLLVVISAYLIFKDRKRIVAIEPATWLLGLFIIFGAIIIFLAGHVAVEYYFQRSSLIILIWGIIGYIFGKRAFRIFFPPMILLLLAVPLPEIVVNALTLPLKSMVSSFSAEMLRSLNIAVLQEGNILLLPGITLEVVNACSGIRSIFALFVLAFLLAHDMQSPLQKISLVVLTIPLAIFTNSLRITTTGVLASHWNREAALSFYHDFGGWGIFVLSLVLLFVSKRLIILCASTFRRRDERA